MISAILTIKTMERYCCDKKTEADSLLKITIWMLKNHGLLKELASGTLRWTDGFSGQKSSIGIEILSDFNDPYLRIYYTQTDPDNKKQEYDYKIPLTTTPCNFGGKRYWFVCPGFFDGKYCGRRVGVLYLGGKYFACRHCYNLTYSSKNQSSYRRFLAKLLNGK
jgi:hypothetical protein